MQNIPPTDATTGWAGFYVPEIHDLSPMMGEVLDDMAGLFAPVAWSKIAYSIVPNWQNNYALDRHPDFAARLRALSGTPVLHGWTHSLGSDALNWLLYGHDNRSEFLGLDRQQTELRLALGQDMMTRSLGASPEWFCAPRWQQNLHLAPALQAQGFRGSLDRGAFTEFGKTPVPIAALNFDEGERAVKIALGAVARRFAIAGIFRSRRPFRMVLHPDDIRRPGTLAQIRLVLRRLSEEGWKPLSIDEAISLWRAGSHE